MNARQMHKEGACQVVREEKAVEKAIILFIKDGPFQTLPILFLSSVFSFVLSLLLLLCSFIAQT